MAVGKIHQKATIEIATPLAGVVGMSLFAMSGDWVYLFTPVLGALAGLILHPDLDQQMMTTEQHKIMKWSAGLGGLWVGMWYTYAMLCKHRGISHWPVLGTWSRLLYLWFHPLVFGLAIAKLGWAGLIWPIYLFGAHFLAFSVGLMIADVIHWGMDGCPGLKKRN